MDSELARRNRELSILNTIAEALNREVDLRRALDVALAHVADLFGLRAGWVWLLDEAGEVGLAATRHLPPALAEAPERMAGSCYCLDTFCAGDLAGAANVSVITCTRLKELIAGTEGLRSHASVPLYAHGRRMGVLNVAGPDWRELSADDLRLLSIVGDLVGMAVERARLFARSVDIGALEERNRLAREIHDTLAQGLAAIALKLDTADALLEIGGPTDSARALVQQAIGLARQHLDDARRSVYGLRAPSLEGRDLAAALADLAAEQAAGFVADGPTATMPERLSGGLYRIAQEALANARRHAQARRVELRLSVAADTVSLSVADDGRGFVPDDVPEGHFGLLGMGERARLLGGELRIASAPGRGTTVEARIPL